MNKPFKINPKSGGIVPKRTYQIRPRLTETSIELSSHPPIKIDRTKKFFTSLQFINTISKDVKQLNLLLRYYAKNLRLCSQIKQLTFSQIILTSSNFKSIIKLIKSLKSLQILTLDIKLGEGLPDSLLKLFYRKLYRLQNIKGLRIFTTNFYQYPFNILRPLFSHSQLQSRLEIVEFSIMRELIENEKEVFLKKLQGFTKLKSLTLDFSRATTGNTLPYLFSGFHVFTRLENLSLNLSGQYLTTETFQNLIQSLTGINLIKLSLTFKCTSTIGTDLPMLLETVSKRLSYLKLVIMDENRLTPEAMEPLVYSFNRLNNLKELHLDVSQTMYCNAFLERLNCSLPKQAKLTKLSLKYNLNEEHSKTQGSTMRNIQIFLSSNHHLKDVYLHCANSQGMREDIEPMAKGIQDLKLLEYLNVYFHFCRFSDYNIKGLIQTIGEKKELKGLTLSIDSYRLTNQSLFDLERHLGKLTTLREVKLKMVNWKIAAQGLDAFSKLLHKFPKLFRVETTLHGSGTEKLTKEFEQKVKKRLPRHRVNIGFRK